MLDAELFVDRFQEPDGIEPRIEYVGRLDLLAQVFQEAAAEGGLAGPDLAGNGHEPVFMHNGALQMGQSLLVPSAQIEIGRVGHQLEGSFLETEKARVHIFSSKMTGRTGSRTDNAVPYQIPARGSPSLGLRTSGSGVRISPGAFLFSTNGRRFASGTLA